MYTRKRTMPSFNFSTSEWLLIIAWGAALLAGGWAFAQQGADMFTGIVGAGRCCMPGDHAHPPFCAAL